jgi:phosphatidate phosphatase APP1
MPTPELATESALRRAARLEAAVRGTIRTRMRTRGWRTKVIAYTGYGSADWIRVLGRVLLSTPGSGPRRKEAVRGWRSFLTLPVPEAAVVIEAGGVEYETSTDRGGYVDCVLPAALAAENGWATIQLHCDGAQAQAPIQVVGPDVRFGIISDVDDTVMVTALPRPMLAAWNTFVLDEHARSAVPGMAVLYERLIMAHPGAPVLYLSTGAWNVAPALTRFLSRHLYPAGPLLLTDWGPAEDAWFRSGQQHKRVTLARLAREFPDVRWLLVGDDGQHDPTLYREFASAYPESVAAVAIRRLSPAQSVLAGTLPAPLDDRQRVRSIRPQGLIWLSAPDGAGLWRLLQEVDLVP